MQNAQGVPSRLISVDEAVALNPFVDPSRYVAAAWSPEDGWAHPAQVVHGYAGAAARLGARIVTGTTVHGITTTAAGTITAVLTGTGTVAADTVVCCAGAWSQQVGQMIGVHLPVEPLRCQIGLTGPVDTSRLADDRPRAGPRRLPFTIDFGSTFYVHDTGTGFGPDFGPAGGGLLLGIADPDQAVGFDRSYDPTWLPMLREAARRCIPALADQPVVQGWAGLYEMTPDSNALIGESGTVSRFLYATGFSGHGFLQAPAVGEVVRDLVTGRRPFVDVGPFSADRYSAARVSLPEAPII